MLRKVITAMVASVTIALLVCGVAMADDYGDGGGHSFENVDGTNWTRVIWTQVTGAPTGGTGPTAYGYVARAWNGLDATCAIIRKNHNDSRLDLVARYKLSNPETGGRFYELYAKLYQTDATVPDWVDAKYLLEPFFLTYGTEYSQYIWYLNPVWLNEIEGAQQDFETICNGGDLGGGSGGGAGEIPDKVTLTGLCGNYYSNNNGHYWPADAIPAANYTVDVYLNEQVKQSISAHIQDYPYLNVLYCRYAHEWGYNSAVFYLLTAEPMTFSYASSGNSQDGYYVYSDKASLQSLNVNYTTNVSGTLIDLSTTSIANWNSKSAGEVGRTNGVDNGIWVYTSGSSGTGGGSGSGGGGGGGEGEPNPWPDTPNPDTDPDPPTVPDVPSDPVVGGDSYTNTNYTTNNYTWTTNNYTYNNFQDVVDGIYEILDAMDSHCIHIQNAIGNAVSDLSSKLVGALNNVSTNVVGAINRLGTNIDSSLNSQFSALKTYLRQLFVWLAEQFEYTFGSRNMFDDTSIINWLKRIYQVLINNNRTTPTPDPIDDGEGFWDWLVRQFAEWFAGFSSNKASQVGGLLSQLTQFFPFSIPWDLAFMLGLLVAQPVTPVLDFPVPVPEIVNQNKMILVHLDCTGWNGAAAVCRTVMYFLFCYALAQKVPDWFNTIKVGDNW